MRGRALLALCVALALALGLSMRLFRCLRASAPPCRPSRARVACVARPAALSFPLVGFSYRFGGCFHSLAPPRPNLYRYVLKHIFYLNHFAVLLAISLLFTTFAIPTRRYCRIIVKITLNENRNYRFYQTDK